MILDNEGQRAVLVQVLDEVAPRVVRGATPQSLEQLNVLVALRTAVEQAEVAPAAAAPEIRSVSA